MRVARLFPLLCLAFFFSLPLVAQQVTNSNATGVPPFGSFHGSELDLVSLQNGNLHITIPILSVPQRGGRSFDYRYLYDIATWQAVWFPTPSQTFPDAGFYRILPMNGEVAGWRLTNPLNWSSFFSPKTANCPTDYLGHGGQSFSYGTGFVLIDPEGTKHPFPFITAESGLPNPPVCGGSTYAGPALDGSGIYWDLRTGFILKDGTKPGEDTNGNLVSGTSDTLQRPLLTAADGNMFTTWTYKDSQGNPQTYRVDYASYNAQTNMCSLVPHVPDPNVPGNSGCVEYATAANLPIKLTLPNSTTYQFTWLNNSVFELLSVQLPTGATISYTYNNLPESQPNTGRWPLWNIRKTVATRTVTMGAQSFQWSYITGTYGVTVTNPDQTSEGHTLTKLGGNGYSVPVETQVTYFDASGHTLRTVNKDWTGELGPDNAMNNVRQIRESTTLDNGLIRKVETDYETFSFTVAPCPGCASAWPSGTFTATRLNSTEKREFAYASGGPGPLLRRTDYSYLHTSNSAYATLNIVDRPTSVITYDASSNIVAQTQFEYDNYTQAIQPSGAVQHDATFSTSYLTRGNVTSTMRWRNTDGAWLTTRKQYDDAGNVLSSTDPLNHTTTFDYTDAWTTQTGGGACAPTSGPAKAYVKTVTNALGQATTHSYFSCTALVGSVTDPNLQVATFSYDLLNRPLMISSPDGGQTSNTYNDSTLITTTSRLQKTTPTTTYVYARKHFDQLGRPSQDELCEDGTSNCTTSIKTDYAYDSLSRLATKSNPYRTSGDPGPTNGVTTLQYDALSRTTRVIPPDGNVSTGANSVSTSYTGNCTTVTDQAGKARKSCSDGLDRLTQVFEDPASANYETDYAYDTLDNLLTVNQKGGTTDTTQWRTRTFTYNSLSQLSNASNPESGTISYTYDTAGSLSRKTDARSISTAYAYDSLNRLTAKTYSDHSPPAAYFYDGQTPPATTPTTGTGTVIFSGSEQSKYVAPPGCHAKSCSTLIYDTGDVSVSVNGFNETVFFGQGSTSSNLASALSAAFNSAPSSPVTASVSGTIVTLTAKTGGSASNYSLSVTYDYDAADFTQSSFTPSGFGFSLTGGCNTDGSGTMTNGVGRRTGMCDSAGAEAWTYDSMGRTVTDRRNTNGVTKTTTYAYNPDGSLAALTYPSGRMINYSYDLAARSTSAADVANNLNYATNAHYSPAGALASLTNGTGISSTYIFNSRLQPCWMYSTTGAALPWNTTNCTGTAATASILDLKYNFSLGTSDNGNVTAISNNRDNTRSQNFSYDSLNRLWTAQTQTTGVTIPNANCWGLTFGYDPWGNQLSSSITGPAGCSEPLPTNFSVGTSNRISTNNVAGQITNYCYDAPGNLIFITAPSTACPTSGPFQYSYDAENHMTSTAGVTYTYDGDGKRIQKSSGTIYWYGTGSDALDETDLTGSITNTAFKEYVFFGGKRIARRDSTNVVNYYFADHLGTARIVTNSTGTMPPLDDSDFYPFGGERPILSSSGNHFKFTAKERDSESGLDNFEKRYYGSAQGRLMSPDPVFFQAEMLTDPQRFNEYAYARNNPLLYVDPSGEAIQLSDDPEEQQKQLNAICSAAGISSDKCSYYVYANKASDGNYYVGIYTNGADAKGTSFQNLNDVAGAIGSVINDQRVVQLDLVAAGTPVTDNEGVTKTIGPVDRRTGATPGGTYLGRDGRWHIALLDPSTGPGSLPGDMMSNGQPGLLDSGIIFGHEIGHLLRDWGLDSLHLLGSVMNEIGGDKYFASKTEADALEAKVRRLRDPNAPIRTRHDY